MHTLERGHADIIVPSLCVFSLVSFHRRIDCARFYPHPVFYIQDLLHWYRTALVTTITTLVPGAVLISHLLRRPRRYTEHELSPNFLTTSSITHHLVPTDVCKEEVFAESRKLQRQPASCMYHSNILNTWGSERQVTTSPHICED
jgi:hypothetical protein